MIIYLEFVAFPISLERSDATVAESPLGVSCVVRHALPTHPLDWRKPNMTAKVLRAPLDVVVDGPDERRRTGCFVLRTTEA